MPGPGDLDPERARQLSATSPRGLPAGHRLYIPEDVPRVLRIEGGIAHIVPAGGRDEDAIPVAYEQAGPDIADLIAQHQAQQGAAAAEYGTGDPLAAAAAEYSQQDPLAVTAVEHQQRLGGIGASEPIADASVLERLRAGAPVDFGAVARQAAPTATDATTLDRLQAGQSPAAGLSPAGTVAITDERLRARGLDPRVARTDQIRVDRREAREAELATGRSGVVQAPPAAPAGGGAPGGPEVVTVPGARGRAVTPGLNPREQGILDTFGREAGAAANAATAVQGASRMREDAIRSGMEAEETIRNEQAEREAERQREMQQAERELRQMRSEVAQQHMDPSRFWSDRGIGAQVVGALGVAIGAAAEALTPGDNPALRMIESAVEDELEAQRVNMAERRADVEGRRQDLERMRDRFRDEREQEAARKVAIWDNVARQLDGITAGLEGETAQANAQQVRAEIERRRLLAEEEFRQAAAIRAQRAAAGRRPQQFAIIEGVRVPITDRNALQVVTAIREGRGTMDSGGLSPNEAATQLRQYGERRAELERGRHEIDALAQQFGRAGEDGDVAGIGTGQSLLRSAGPGGRIVADVAAGPEGRRNRADLEMAVQRGVQAITGATATPEQQEAVRRSLGLEGPIASEEDARRAISAIRDRLEQEQRTVDASTPPAVRSMYEQNQATIPRGRAPGTTGASSFRRAGQ